MSTEGQPSEFTAEEERALAPFFTNVDKPVFALVNLPETVKGALFARYSRSAKSLRRLFLDEFYDGVQGGVAGSEAGRARAENLYHRVLNDFGDDSVAQLGGCHVACERVSNLLTKVLEWGRLMSYLEQSTRYVPYTDRSGGRWRYHVPRELRDDGLRRRYVETLDRAFETYAAWIEPMQEHFRRLFPKPAEDSEGAYRAAIRAKALDSLRGLLPAATQSNVGIYGSGQAFEALLLRMRAHALGEVRDCADLVLAELRKVIPAFLSRVDEPSRGVRSTKYLQHTRSAIESEAQRLLAPEQPADSVEVALTDFDPEGELKVVAAALYAVSALPDGQLLSIARRLTPDERDRVLRSYVGERQNRRHKPGRAFERTSYRFDVLTDYGAFRDLQRHRLLTIEWQELSPRFGYDTPPAVLEAGADEAWRGVMERSAELHQALVDGGHRPLAPYAVTMAHRVRFCLQMNAREAMHMIELRTGPQGHSSYRRVCQAMHRLIAEQAGHQGIARAISFADHSPVELERLAAEQRLEERRRRSEDRR